MKVPSTAQLISALSHPFASFLSLPFTPSEPLSLFPPRPHSLSLDYPRPPSRSTSSGPRSLQAPYDDDQRTLVGGDGSFSTVEMPPTTMEVARENGRGKTTSIRRLQRVLTVVLGSTRFIQSPNRNGTLSLRRKWLNFKTHISR